MKKSFKMSGMSAAMLGCSAGFLFLAGVMIAIDNKNAAIAFALMATVTGVVPAILSGRTSGSCKSQTPQA